MTVDAGRGSNCWLWRGQSSVTHQLMSTDRSAPRFMTANVQLFIFLNQDNGPEKRKEKSLRDELSYLFTFGQQ